MNPTLAFIMLSLAATAADGRRPAAALGPPAEHNLAVVSIDTPAAAYCPPLVPFVPAATIRNAGADPEDSFAVFCAVYDSLNSVVHFDSVQVPDTLFADSLRQIVFPSSFTPQPGMSYLVKAYTALADDGYPNDDTLARAFSSIPYHDLAVAAIDTPAAFVVPPGVAFAPSAMVRNSGTSAENGFRVWFVISDSAALPVYADSLVVGALPAQTDTQLLFAPFTPDTFMEYRARAFTALAGDSVPANDTARLDFRTFEYVGAVGGRVRDANAGGAPLADAVLTAVSADGAYADTTDGAGDYSFPALPAGTYALTAAKPGYVDSTVMDIVVGVGAGLTRDFELGYPSVALAPADSVSVLLPPASRDSSRFIVVRNTGTRELRYGISWPWRAAKALGDSLWGLDVEAVTSDNLCLGVEFDGAHLWVSGAAGSPSGDPNYLYQLDTSGTLRAAYPQPQGNGWGWRDLCWDGQFLYAGSDSVIMQIDTVAGETTGVRIPAPVAVARGLAWDPGSDHFFVADFADSIYEIGRGGGVVNAWANGRNVFGLAWDGTAPDGPWLWALHDSFDSYTYTSYLFASQFDPRAGAYTGLRFRLRTIDPANAAAGGLAFTTALRPGRGALVALLQDAHDRLAAYDVRPDNARWLSLSHDAGTLAPGAQDSIRLTFDNEGLDSIKDYAVQLRVGSNAPAGADSLLAVMRSPYSGCLALPDIARCGFALLNARPNPVRSQTTIAFSLPRAQQAELTVYNAAGQRVRTLCSANYPAGWHAVRWDGRNERGQQVASGVYLYRLRAAAGLEVRKLTVVR
ncbi:MAG TPA: carboxypeptidase regulatory-like domain-containing protein [Candidatus Edwardsbacteria bacterium]|nr:carboxypeptidase regulatory-like domain-containing protein [Candidatus Edwardsbacteria bacterium]